MKRVNVSKETRESFGEFIHHRREERGLGIREIERISDGLIKAPYLSRIEHGRENPPGPELLTKLAEILEVDRDEMFARAKKMPPELQEVYFEEEKVRDLFRIAREDAGKVSDVVAKWKISKGVETEARNRTIELQNELERWIEILKNQYYPEKIILFGSFAHGRVGRWSDIDLVIVKETHETFLDRIKEVLLLLQPKVGVDILVYTPQEVIDLSTRGTFIKKEILSKGITLYEKGS